MYKRRKKPTVELTSLLDLLFVMIFLSLIQQKGVKAPVKPTPAKVTKATPTKAVPVKKVHSVSAVFNFYETPSNPGIPVGAYRMQGRYDEKTGLLSLGGVNWMNRPKGYDMVPLSGKINAAGNLFTGRIEFQGCKQFTLRKTAKVQSSNPLTGEWKGVYDCQQGSTGLTLSID